MRTVCAPGPVVNGVDVSHWNGYVDWAAKKKAGYEFAMIKAEDVVRGQIIIDDTFKGNWKDSKDADILRGAYSFFHPSHNSKEQADRLATLATGMDLPPIIDWEVTDGTAESTDREAGLEFLIELENLTKKTPILYGGSYFLQALGLDSRFAKYPLWVAHYGVKCPLVPAPWMTWIFWQWTGSNGLDRNEFNGSLDQLKTFAS